MSFAELESGLRQLLRKVDGGFFHDVLFTRRSGC